jgi:hypothetical protein
MLGATVPDLFGDMPNARLADLFIGGPVCRANSAIRAIGVDREFSLDPDTLRRFAREIVAHPSPLMFAHKLTIGMLTNAWVQDDTLHVAAQIWMASEAALSELSNSDRQWVANLFTNVERGDIGCFAIGYDVELRPTGDVYVFKEVSVCYVSQHKEAKIVHVDRRVEYKPE